jgi:hypothetical protein
MFNAAVAHQVEQQTENLCVAGSSPACGTTLRNYMIKSTPAAKPQNNFPPVAPIGDTSRQLIGGQKPATEPLPTMADVPGYLGGPA